jgi:hypothetical protein
MSDAESMADYYDPDHSIRSPHIPIVPVEKATWRGRHLRSHPLNLDNPKKIRLFLQQDRFWVNANLEEVRVKNMDAEYLFSTMVWLMKRAPEVTLAVVLDLVSHGEVTQFSPADPYQYIHSTPLFQKLEERYLKLMAG